MRDATVLQGKHWRIGILTESLIRLEWSDSGEFEDRLTQMAVNRDFGADPEFTVTHRNGLLIVDTPALYLTYDGKPFSKEGLSIVVKGVSDTQFNTWHYGDAPLHNLKGTARTLDEADGEIALDDGVLSRDGWAVIDDSGSNVIVEADEVDGKTNPLGTWVRPRDHAETDIYFFGYGRRYIEAVQDFYTLAGPTPLLPRYALGNWWSRYYRYTQTEYLELMDRFKNEGIPFTTSVIDMDWHRVDDVNPKYGSGWTGYSWNSQLFPDHCAFLRSLHERGLKATLNVHPRDGIRAYEDDYETVAKRVGIDPTTGEAAEFDLTNPDFVDAYLDMHHRMEDEGVDFWWLDWQQDYLYPLVRGTNMKHLPWMNHIYYNYSSGNHLRGAGFSRWAGWGDHRHPIQFSGDAVGNWDLLRFEVDLTTTSGNAGCFFWAHDLGGFYDGTDPELYTRWTQFGLLNSSLRIHSVYDEKLDRRPWLWGVEAEKAMHRIYHLRSQLMPYIYSSVRQCHTDMLPLNRGMYIEYPDEEKAYQYPGQFLFGDLLLGAPITAKGEGEKKIATQEVWLPGGTDWYNFFTGERQEGGQVIKTKSPLEQFPLFIKGGCPLPMQPYTERMCSTPLTELIVRCYPGKEGANNTYILYEDDGLTQDYLQGKYATTRLNYQKSGGQTIITVSPVEGTYEGQPRKRAYRIELPGIPVQARVSVNGKKARTTPNQELNGVIVPIKVMDIHKPIVIKIQ